MYAGLQDKERAAFLGAQMEREAELDAKTAKNKSKRDKRKAAKQRAKESCGDAALLGTGDKRKAAPERAVPRPDAAADDGAKKRKVAPGAESLTFSRPDEDSDDGDV